MSKNPFSIYDFMGYLFPGVVVLVLFLAFSQIGFDVTKLDKITLASNPELSGKFDLEKSFILIVLCYILGHIVAYLSSITVEFASNKIFGYPSKYLLCEKRQDWKSLFFNYFATEGTSSNSFFKVVKLVMKFLLKLLVMLLIFPVLFSIYTIGYIFDINGFICRQLDSYLCETIIGKEYLLAKMLNIKHPDVNEECDYHRIILHYVYLNIASSQRKTDNYIALYGFLRSVCLLSSIMFLLVSVLSLKTIDFSAPFDYYIIGTICFFYFVSYLTFLGFVKFYRRYTLENFMALLTCTSEDQNGAIKVNK